MSRITLHTQFVSRGYQFIIIYLANGAFVSTFLCLDEARVHSVDRLFNYSRSSFTLTLRQFACGSLSSSSSDRGWPKQARHRFSLLLSSPGNRKMLFTRPLSFSLLIAFVTTHNRMSPLLLSLSLSGHHVQVVQQIFLSTQCSGENGISESRAFT